MTQEEFEQRIKRYSERYTDQMEKIMVKGAISFALRMATTYPELAKAYYDALPKATLD